MINHDVVLVLNRCNKQTASFLHDHMYSPFDEIAIYRIVNYMVADKIGRITQPINFTGKTIIGVKHLERMMFLTGIEFSGIDAVRIVIDEAIREQGNQNDESFF